VLPNPSISSQVGVSLAMVGMLLGVNRATRLVMNGPVGFLYEKLPRRPLLVASLVLGTVSSMFYAIGSGFWPLFSGRVLWGIAWSLLWIGGNTVVLDISTDENRGRHSGQYQRWFFLGVALSSFLGGMFTDLFGFRVGQWLSATLIGGAALLWFFFLPETRPADRHERRTQPGKIPQGSFPWRIVMGVSLPIFVARFVSWGVLASTSILWLSSLIGEGLRLSNHLIPIATLTGAYTALRMITSIGSASAAGFLSDRSGYRWPVISVAMLVGGIGIWLMSMKLLTLALVGAFLSPVIDGSIETLVPAIAGDRIDKVLQGRALGLIYTIADLGGTLGPPIVLGVLGVEWLPLDIVYKGSAILFVFVVLFALVQARGETPNRGCEKIT
jgi:MFS family permease